MGRNSATGSPRRSITIMPPSAASRTNSDVWMCNSRTEVFLTMLHCSAGLPGRAEFECGTGWAPERCTRGNSRHFAGATLVKLFAVNDFR
jgi:hypothetical protein